MMKLRHKITFIAMMIALIVNFAMLLNTKEIGDNSYPFYGAKEDLQEKINLIKKYHIELITKEDMRNVQNFCQQKSKYQTVMDTMGIYCPLVNQEIKEKQGVTPYLIYQFHEGIQTMEPHLKDEIDQKEWAAPFLDFSKKLFE